MLLSLCLKKSKLIRRWILPEKVFILCKHSDPSCFFNFSPFLHNCIYVACAKKAMLSVMVFISDFKSHGYIELRLRPFYANQDLKLDKKHCVESKGRVEDTCSWKYLQLTMPLASPLDSDEGTSDCTQIWIVVIRWQRVKKCFERGAW